MRCRRRYRLNRVLHGVVPHGVEPTEEVGNLIATLGRRSGKQAILGPGAPSQGGGSRKREGLTRSRFQLCIRVSGGRDSELPYYGVIGTPSRVV